MIKELIFYLREIKNNIDKPTVLHVITKKGKGYLPAENEPNKFHGISSKNALSSITMSKIVGSTLCDLAVDNPKITVITAAMADGTGTADFRTKFPDKFFDVGIAEEHAVTFSAGLAVQGMKPYVAIYSTFLQRAYDQIIHDVCLQNLPVTFCIDRAGFVGEDGQTHQGLFDICFLSSIPNIKILAPSSSKQLKQILIWSATQYSPIAIRYPKSEMLLPKEFSADFDANHWAVFGDKYADFVILAVGNNALLASINAMEELKNEKISLCVVDAYFVKPLDEYLLQTLKNAKLIITIEEGMLTSGFGSMIDTYFSNKNFYPKKIIHLGVNNKFVKHATVLEQLKQFGITSENLINLIKNNI